MGGTASGCGGSRATDAVVDGAPQSSRLPMLCVGLQLDNAYSFEVISCTDEGISLIAACRNVYAASPATFEPGQSCRFDEFDEHATHIGIWPERGARRTAPISCARVFYGLERSPMGAVFKNAVPRSIDKSRSIFIDMLAVDFDAIPDGVRTSNPEHESKHHRRNSIELVKIFRHQVSSESEDDAVDPERDRSLESSDVSPERIRERVKRLSVVNIVPPPTSHKRLAHNKTTDNTTPGVSKIHLSVYYFFIMGIIDTAVKLYSFNNERRSRESRDSFDSPQQEDDPLPPLQYFFLSLPSSFGETLKQFSSGRRGDCIDTFMSSLSLARLATVSGQVKHQPCLSFHPTIV